MALSSGFGLRRPSCNRGITERRTEVVGIFPERDVHPPGSSVHPAGAERRVSGAASSRHDPRDPHGVLEPPPAFHLPAVAARAPWPRPAHTVRSRSHTTSWDNNRWRSLEPGEGPGVAAIAGLPNRSASNDLASAAWRPGQKAQPSLSPAKRHDALALLQREAALCVPAGLVGRAGGRGRDHSRDHSPDGEMRNSSTSPRRRSSSASWPSSSRRAVLRTMRYSNARPLSTRR